MAPAHPVGTAPAVAVPAPPPATRGKQGGGKGLVVGLGAVGGLLFIAIAIIAVKSMKPEDDLPVENPLGTPGPSGPVTVAPQVPTVADVPSAAPTGDTPPEPTTPIAKVPPKQPSQGSGSGGKPAPPADACDACIAAARSGNLSAASAKLSQCTDPQKQGQCKLVARQGAKSAVRTAAMSGNCTQANSIISAAAALGADVAAKSGLAGSNCK